ncbi:MAG: flavodoxin domain-containing protein, partial [Promethearchaeota archaeon]
SPTIGRGILSSMAEIMEMIKGLGFKNKKAASFGSYGWSGESVKELNSLLEKSKFELLNEGIRIKWNPDEAAKKECFEFGKEIGLKLVEK